MPRRNTMPADINPLSIIVPEQDNDNRAQSVRRRTAPPTREEGTPAERPREERKSKPVSAKKIRVAFYLSEDLADEIRNGVVHLSGPPLRLNMTLFAEMALQKELECLRAEHNGGKPFPKRDEDLKGGRPIR